MADSIKETLTRKLGPLPTWAWVAVGGGIGVLILLRKKGGGSPASAASNVPSGYALLGTGNGGAVTAGSGGGGIVTGGGSTGTTGTTQPPQAGPTAPGGGFSGGQPPQYIAPGAGGGGDSFAQEIANWGAPIVPGSVAHNYATGADSWAPGTYPGPTYWDFGGIAYVPVNGPNPFAGAAQAFTDKYGYAPPNGTQFQLGGPGGYTFPGMNGTSGHGNVAAALSGGYGGMR